MSVDLKTTYMGLSLKNPLVPSASPLSKDISTIKQLEESGASAVILHSLFEEEITHESQQLHHYLVRDENSFGEAMSYFPDLGNYSVGPDGYLEHVRKAKEEVSIPVIASLNGISSTGWIDFAKKIEEAGADALELNVYFIPTDTTLSGVDVERLYVDVLEAVKGSIKIPVAMKLSPFFSSVANVAQRLDAAGADALVLFNRFYQPDIDIEQKQAVPSLALSTSASSRLPMRWVAVLHGQVKASLAASTGIHTAEDVVKLLMAGADVTMMTAALLQNGTGHLWKVQHDLQRWMEEHEYGSVNDLKGCVSLQNTAEPAAFERANYMKALANYGS